MTDTMVTPIIAPTGISYPPEEVAMAVAVYCVASGVLQSDQWTHYSQEGSELTNGEEEELVIRAIVSTRCTSNRLLWAMGVSSIEGLDYFQYLIKDQPECVL